MTAERTLGFDVNAPGTSVFIIQVVFLALAWITSLMRAFVKLVLLRKALVDDYLMLVALLGYTATGYFVFSAVIDGGLGRLPRELSLESNEVSLRSWFGNMALSGPVSGLARISIALFLLRITVKRWHRVVLHTIIGATAIMTIVYFFIVVFQCSPPSYFWLRIKEGAKGSCGHGMGVQAATLVWGSFAVAMDWLLGLLPIAILWGVRINRQSKVGIAAILSFGIIAGIALIVRLIFIRLDGPSPGDAVYGTLTVSISAIVELALGIIAGCIATLPPLFRRMGLHFGGSSKESALTDTIPWQRSFAGPEPRHQGAENLILMSPRRLEREQDARDDVETRRPRAKSPSTKRVLSSSNWDIDIEVAGPGDDGPLPSGKEIQIRTDIKVSSHPSRGNLSVSTIDFVDKPLPPPPPRPTARDRSIPRSRPLTPTLF
ncbi:hypothetical protein O1611_g1262 [Lasiodiplodia mahajangana]|uniref:Uncharacterized protein n=1 Tax=Lasiodiplodia mahajangana TaxID=1108764 RepID=A0ACC2JY22_9PEZI|nr:hypothetical protein O1611_g1262 [Lasiodiplodia mahajangana]